MVDDIHALSDLESVARVPAAPGQGELLDSLMSTLPDAVYFKDVRGRFLRTNEAMAVCLGLSHPCDAVGRVAAQMPNASVALALQGDDEEVLRSGESHQDQLAKWEGQPGAPDWALVTRWPIRDRTGAVVGVVGVVHDVTEQKRAEEKVDEAVRHRDQFLAMLSHELRNPLGAIVSATSLLEKRLGSGELGRPIAVLRRQSLHMARLLDDLLEANRVTENRIELRKCVLDLRTVVDEAVEATRDLMASRGLAFTVDVDPGAVWVDGDRERLQQVQVNLLRNAANFTPPGGHVGLSLARDGNEAVLRVRDDGSGIPKAMLEAVFELFVQTGRSLDRAQGGLGLGLTLARSLVSMHGGSVVANSDGDGLGSEFVVRLPLARSSAGPGDDERSSAEPAGDERSSAGPCDDERSSARAREDAPPPSSAPRLRLSRHATIALIEDNVDTREMMSEALSDAGFECRSTDNGVDGLALIEAVRPDIALIDVGLPAMNGFDVARRIRAQPRYAGVRLVALTGYGMRGDRARALSAGFDDHLTKPIEPEALVKYIAGSSR